MEMLKNVSNGVAVAAVAAVELAIALACGLYLIGAIQL